MSRNLRIAGLATLIAACSAGAAFAAGVADPQQRARDMITPSFPSDVSKPKGAMGRLIVEPESYGDPSSHAAALLKHDQWPASAVHSGSSGGGSSGGYSDPQERARSMILGRES